MPATTKSITISVNGGLPTSYPYGVNGPTCVVASGTVTCTYDVAAPIGADTFAVQALNGTSKVLASATVQATVSVTTTVVSVTLAGVPANANVTLASSTVPAGTATAVPVTVTATDADGNTISGAYANPVTLTNDDKSVHTALSPNPVKSSTDTVALNYDGKAAVNARISTTFNTTPGFGGAIFATSLAAHEYAVPSGTPASSNAGTGTIVMGGDGAMWFGEQNGVGRADASGTITEYPMVQPQQMVRGADGAVWFTTYYDRATGNSGELCRVAPDGSVTKLNVNIGARFVLGSDGNFWDVDDNGYVKRVTPSGTVSTFPLTSPPGALNPGVHVSDIVALPDGNLRALDYANLIIYTVNTSGSQIATTQISTGHYLSPGGSAATVGPDNFIWYVGQNEVVVTPNSGYAYEFSQLPGTLTFLNGVGNGAPMLSGSDVHMWTSGRWLTQAPAMFRITPSFGAVIALPLPDVPPLAPGSQPVVVGAANGPNNTIWYVRGSTVGWFTPPG
ncbi:MAG TPA: hypothetical protein VK665_09490 [Candidatus Elarobacter sp.]|nr:hypothetical protein [Candidatus Elarobacter sp.]